MMTPDSGLLVWATLYIYSTTFSITLILKLTNEIIFHRIKVSKKHYTIISWY